MIPALLSRWWGFRRCPPSHLHYGYGYGYGYGNGPGMPLRIVLLVRWEVGNRNNILALCLGYR